MTMINGLTLSIVVLLFFSNPPLSERVFHVGGRTKKRKNYTFSKKYSTEIFVWPFRMWRPSVVTRNRWFRFFFCASEKESKCSMLVRWFLSENLMAGLLYIKRPTDTNYYYYYCSSYRRWSNSRRHINGNGMRCDCRLWAKAANNRI